MVNNISCYRCHKQVIALGLRKCERCGVIQCESCGFTCHYCWGATQPVDYYNFMSAIAPAAKKAWGLPIAVLALVLSFVTATVYFVRESSFAPMSINQATSVSQVREAKLRPFNVILVEKR